MSTNWVIRVSDDEDRPREVVEQILWNCLPAGFRVLSLGQPMQLNPQPLRVTPVPADERTP